MASKLQIAITLVVLFGVIAAFGYQVRILWEDVEPIMRGSEEDVLKPGANK